MRTDDLGRARAEKGRANHIDAGVHACDVSLDAKQATTVVRSIFYGVTSEGERRDASFLYATVCAMIEDAFSADATASWATRSDVDGADATKAVIRIDGYRLLKMLLSVFVDTTPPADAFVGKPIKTQSKASRREAATRDLSSAMETVEVRPKPKLPPAAVATAKPEPSPTPSAEATKEIALYHATLRAAVTDAVGKYAAALFPKEVPKQSIDEAQTKLDALAQDLLKKIIDDDAEIGSCNGSPTAAALPSGLPGALESRLGKCCGGGSSGRVSGRVAYLRPMCLQKKGGVPRARTQRASAHLGGWALRKPLVLVVPEIRARAPEGEWGEGELVLVVGVEPLELLVDDDHGDRSRRNKPPTHTGEGAVR